MKPDRRITETGFITNTRRITAEKGLKNKAVAQRIGITEKQFSNLMNGRRIIKDVDVIAIASALDVTPNDLFGIYPKKDS